MYKPRRFCWGCAWLKQNPTRWCQVTGFCFPIRKVLCENLEREDTQTLRSRMRRWYEKECLVFLAYLRVTSVIVSWLLSSFSSSCLSNIIISYVFMVILVISGFPFEGQHPRVIIPLELQFYHRIQRNPPRSGGLTTLPNAEHSYTLLSLTRHFCRW